MAWSDAARKAAAAARRRKGGGKRGRKLSKKKKIAIGAAGAVAVGAGVAYSKSGRRKARKNSKNVTLPGKHKALKSGTQKKSRLKTKNSGKRKRRVGKPFTKQKALTTGKRNGKRIATKSKGSNYSDRRVNAVKKRRNAREGTTGSRSRIMINKKGKNTSVRRDHFDIASGLRQGKSRKKRRR